MYPTVLASGSGSGAWTVSGISPALAMGDTLYAIAQLDPDVNSSHTATATVKADFANLAVPTSFAWSGGNYVDSSTLGVGTDTGTTTAGAVTSGGATWTLAVSDGKTNNNGYMTVSGIDDVSATKLAAAIEVGYTAGTVDTIANYQGEIQNLTVNPNYGPPSASFQGQASDSIPLFTRQAVAATDVPGAYSITLNYTISPTY